MDIDWLLPGLNAGNNVAQSINIHDACFRTCIPDSLDGAKGRGSARSIANVHLFEALQRVSEHLIAFGGHAHAAGVEVAAASVEALRKALNGTIPVAPAEMVPALEIEAEVGLPDLSPALLAELSRLEPFGSGNRPPLFAVRGLEVAGAPRVMGQDGTHLSFFVRSASQPSAQSILKAVAFGRAHLSPELSSRGRRIDLAFRPMVNRWGGSRSY